MFTENHSRVQTYLLEQGLDGWLIFDFRGRNPFIQRVFQPAGGLLTRRWWVWVPAQGEPAVLVHAIEFGSFPKAGYTVHAYSSRDGLPQALRSLMGGARRVAMEYSPLGNIPYISVVDGGTLELIRSVGVEVVSSGDLLQQFLTWTPEQLSNHRKAAQALAEVKDAALVHIRAHVQRNEPLDEYALQQYMNHLLQSNGLETGHAPIVGFGPGSGDPHYIPSAGRSKTLEAGDAILMDLWAKVPGDNPYADITWMAFHGTPSERFVQVFRAVLAARDAGLELLRQRFTQHQPLRGYEVDQAVRAVLVQAGYGPQLKHRTGHSLGIHSTHGEAAHFDGYETWDERQVLPRVGFTLEPGVYFEEFGVRSEINLYTLPEGIEVTTPVQTTLDVMD